MGAFLEKPKTDKTTVAGEGYGLRYGVSAMQGWRMEMEDSHVCTTDFKFKNWSFFGVFDGHAGPKVSQYSAEHILENILKHIPDENASDESLKKAIAEGFVNLDEAIKGEPTWAHGEDHSGTTAITVMISPTTIIWANCGDSRGFLCRKNSVHFATIDHKPYNDIEKTRIEKAGGTVMMQRVNGSLAVSRALGDFDYKRNTSLKPEEQLVSPVPDVEVIPRDNKEDEFLLLACDGIYDVMTNEEVLAFVRHKLRLTSDLAQICSDLIDLCLNKNSRDNMSVILVVFPNAPQVSDEAIKEEEQRERKAKEDIRAKIEEMVNGASDPLEIEENYVLQQLSTECSAEINVHGMRPYISDLLNELSKAKFGEMDKDMEFNGPSDPNAAPPEFNLPIYTKSGEMHISSTMEEVEWKEEDALLLKSNYNPLEESEEIEVALVGGGGGGETRKSEEEGEKMEVTEEGNQETVSDKLQQDGQPPEAAT